MGTAADPQRIGSIIKEPGIQLIRPQVFSNHEAHRLHFSS